MSNSTIDHNLLFGVIAVQLGVVRPDDLDAAMRELIAHPFRSLDDVLVERRMLEIDEAERVHRMVREHLALQDTADQATSLAANDPLATRPPEDSPGATAPEDPHATRPLAEPITANEHADPYATRADSVAGAAGTAPSIISTGGVRFRKVRSHAKGGLGEVFVAIDEELRREVALKEIQERNADHNDSRARFLLEAEVTGSLEHPGIVPVYGLGQYPDGRPYYAMRFISGDSLLEAIEHFHKADGPKRNPAERSLALRQLLRRFIDACNAIGYAHSRGVIHRDIKPANIMLGKYGETLVVDWGLAKTVDDADKHGSTEEKPVRLSSDSGSVQTVAGSVVGTPQFMSPEQAAGRVKQLGPSSDVYSLGATLYMLLTGQPPFNGANTAEVLQQVQRGAMTPMRGSKRRVPPALEAVCRRAMALNSTDRYPSARSLADDVEHWLADEAVSAYREPWRARAGRWMRRHRTRVTAAGVALLVTAVGLGVATVLLTAANDREREAKQMAEKNAREAAEQRDMARANFQQTREAVDRFFTRVSESEEMKSQGMEKLRTKLLEEAAEYYLQFVRGEFGHEPSIEDGRGRAYFCLSDLYRETGHHDKAEQSCRDALALYEKLAREHPDVPAYQEGLATAHFNLARVYGETGRDTLAEQAHRTAISLYRKLVSDHPEVHAYRAALARPFVFLGTIYSKQGNKKKAEDAYREGLAIRQKLVSEHPDVPDYQDKLCRSYLNLGNLYHETDRNDQAEQADLEALARCQKLVAAHPDVLEYRHFLAYYHNNLAVLYADTGRNDLAEKQYLQALAIREKLAPQHPEVTTYQQELARVYNNLAIRYGATNRRSQAEKAYQQALAIRQKLALGHPEVPGYQHDLALSYHELATLHSNMGRKDLAEKGYLEALTVWRKLVEAQPSITTYRKRLASTLHSLGWLYHTTNQHDLAEKNFLESLAIRRTLVREEPTVTDHTVKLALTLHDLGLVYTATGAAEQAEKAYHETLAIRQKLVDEHPTNAEYRGNLAWTSNNLGVLYSVTGRADPAEAAHREALALRRSLVAEHPQVVTNQQNLALSLGYLAKLYRDSGRDHLAEQSLREALTIRAALADREPHVSGTQQDLARSCKALGDLYRLTGRPDLAMEQYAAAALAWDQAMALSKGPTRERLRLSRAVALVGADPVLGLSEVEKLAQFPAPSGEDLYTLACAEALAAATLQRDSQGAKLAEPSARRAVELLRRAHDTGYFKDSRKIAELKNATDLKAVHSRAEFKRLLTELGAAPE